MNGTRIYNHGDMANAPHWGTIIDTMEDSWGTHVTVSIDDDDRTYRVPAEMIGNVYKGNGLTRIVTKEAYDAWRQEQIAKITAVREVA